MADEVERLGAPGITPWALAAATAESWPEMSRWDFRG